jgi:hypothetical protein
MKINIQHERKSTNSTSAEGKNKSRMKEHTVPPEMKAGEETSVKSVARGIAGPAPSR